MEVCLHPASAVRPADVVRAVSQALDAAASDWRAGSLRVVAAPAAAGAAVASGGSDAAAAPTTLDCVGTLVLPPAYAAHVASVRICDLPPPVNDGTADADDAAAAAAAPAEVVPFMAGAPTVFVYQLASDGPTAEALEGTSFVWAAA